MTRWSLLLATACVLVLGVASVGLAAPPHHFTDSIDYSDEAPCTGFNDVFVGHLDVSGVTSFDKQGNRVREVFHYSGWETNSRSDRPSVSITAKRNFTEIFDWTTGILTDVGNVYTQTAPGQGVLFHDVGFISFGDPVTIHGPHDVFDQGQAAFCNALLAVS